MTQQQAQAPQADAQDVIEVLKEQIGNLNYNNVILTAQLKKAVEQNQQLKTSVENLRPKDGEAQDANANTGDAGSDEDLPEVKNDSESVGQVPKLS